MPSTLLREMLLDTAVVAAGGGFVCMLVAAIHAVVRQASTRASEAPLARRPCWPRAGHYVLAAVLLTFAGIYGSLVPFSFRPLDIHEAIERFRHIPWLSLELRHRADFLENLVLFIPISYCWLASLAVDRRGPGRSERPGPYCWRTAAAALLVIAASVLVSVALEFTQLWFPPRTVSQNDIVAETAGALIGVGLWLLLGQAATDWVRSYSRAASRRQQVDWLLQAYCIGLLISCLVPFDLVLSASELALKHSQGRICWVYVPGADVGIACLLNLLRDVAVFTPLGMLAATWRAPAERPVRGIGMSVLIGTAVVLATESAQVFVYTRSAAGGDVMAAALGVFVGACVMRCCRGGDRARPQAAEAPSAGRAWLWLGLAGVYSVLLVVILCAPFEPIADLDKIKARSAGFFRVPFAGLYRTIDLEALSDVVKKTALFALLGALLGLAVRPLSVRPAVGRTLLAVSLVAAAALGVLIEMAQAILPPHVPDVTDAILYAAGAGLGLLVTIRPAGR